MMLRTGLVNFSLLFSALIAAVVFSTDTIGEPGRRAGGKNALKKVYFGEQHLHTQHVI
jgi:hypothetical protein